METTDTPTVRSVALVLMTADELAELMQTSVRSVWRWNSLGAIPKPIRIGGTVRWRRRDILEWIEAGCPTLQASDNNRRRS